MRKYVIDKILLFKTKLTAVLPENGDIVFVYAQDVFTLARIYAYYKSQSYNFIKFDQSSAKTLRRLHDY